LRLQKKNRIGDTILPLFPEEKTVRKRKLFRLFFPEKKRRKKRKVRHGIQTRKETRFIFSDLTIRKVVPLPERAEHFRKVEMQNRPLSENL